MNRDSIEGTATSTGGKFKSAMGDIIQDRNLQGEGLIDQAKGAAQTVYGNAKEAVSSSIDDTAARLREATDTAVATARNAPIMTALAIGAAGVALGLAISGAARRS